ncbi:MAG: tetratricopeptide repeat protein [bacterium]
MSKIEEEPLIEEPPIEFFEENGKGELVESNIDDAQTKVLIGKASLQLEDYDKAIEYLLKAVEIQPDLKDQIDPHLAEAYRQAAKAKLDAEDFSGAVQYFRKMIDLDFRKLDDSLPNIINAYVGYAKEMDRKGEADQVFESYNAITKLSENNTELLMGLGRINFEINRYSNALEVFERVNELDENMKAKTNIFISRIYMSRGKNDLNNGSYDKAIKNLVLAKENNESLEEEVDRLLVEAHLKFGETFNRMGKYEEAEEQWKKCFELAPDSLVIYSKLGLFYIERGKSEKALEMYNRMNELEPDNLEVLEKIADLTLKLKQFEKAQEILLRVVSLDTENLYTRFNKYLAEIYLQEEKYNSTVKYYLDYLDFYPGDAEAAYNLARAYSFTKEYALANEYYKQAISIDKSWKNKGGFSMGFRFYRMRALVIILFLFLISSLIAVFFVIQAKRKHGSPLKIPV